MKTILPILSVIALFLFSCQKSDDEIQDVPTQNETEEIIYNDLEPDLILHPVTSFGPHPSGLCSEVIPNPGDSSVTAEIDINGDGVNDFKFKYKNYYSWLSASNRCANYNSLITIEGLYPTAEIAVSMQYLKVEAFNLNDTIGSASSYNQFAKISQIGGMAFANMGNVYGTMYLGLKLESTGYGWVKVDFVKSTFTLTVMDYVLNRTVDFSIKAGQVE